MSLCSVFASFWIFGLVNNVLYVVILSAAIDLVGTKTPKAIVLMADVLPSFICKLTAPFYIQDIPYSVRIWVLVILSSIGMLITALFHSTFMILLGIALASASSGFGELTFLQLTHFYKEISIHGWSSGTGGAGLVGALVFMLLTTVLGVSPKVTLLLFSLAPLNFLGTYFYLLPPHSRDSEYEMLDEPTSETPFIVPQNNFCSTITRIKPYIIPYMGPLFTVYMAEYIINQGISPTLLFPIDHIPFAHYRDAYVTYSTFYQLGVFISRSSGSFVRFDFLFLPSILQTVNLILCIFQSLYMWIPNIYLIFALIFYEGLLGGISYVNTYRQLSERTSPMEREFAMGCVGMSDSGGIVVAALASMILEPSLCTYQVHDGRPWCRME